MELSLVQVVKNEQPNILSVNLQAFIPWVRKCRAVHQQRQQLAELSFEQLDDIGLTPEHVAAELKRAWYDLPKQD